MCDLLEEAVDLKTRRSLDLATKGERLHRPSVDSPHLVIVVDELATLSAFAERTVVRRIEHALGPPAHPGPRGRDHRDRSSPGPRQGRRQLA